MSQRFDIGNIQQPFWIGTKVTLTFTMIPPANVAGWTVLFAVKQRTTDNSFVLSKTPTTIDSNNGVWQVVLQRADTELFAAVGTYVYSLERTDTGNEDVLSYGQINATQKVEG